MNKRLTVFLFLSVTAVLLYTWLSLLPRQPSRQLEGPGAFPHRGRSFSETGENKTTQKKAKFKVDGQKQKNKQLIVKLAPNQQQEKELTDSANSRKDLKRRPKVKPEDSKKRKKQPKIKVDANKQQKYQTTDTANISKHFKKQPKDGVDASKQLRKGPRDKTDANKQQEQRPIETADARYQQERVKETALTGNLTPMGVFPSEGSGQKYLVYLCHGHQLCGGWADRQRGLVSVFFLSLATDRKFGMVMDTPCNVSHFYLPRDVNWLIPEEELKGRKSMMINDMGSRAKLTSRLQTMDFNQEYPHDVVYIRTNNPAYHKALTHIPRYAAKLPHWARSSSPYAFAQAWKRLMRPSEYLQHQLDGYLTSIQFRQRTHPLVCCHVRIGKSDTIKNDGKTRMNVSDISVLWEFVDWYVRNGSRVFLATDNHEIRNRARQRFGSNVTDTGGSIVHVDRALRDRSLRRALSDGDVCEGFGDAVLDQLILTLCDVLVITPSGFGLRAAFIRGTGDNLFRFAERKVSKITI